MGAPTASSELDARADRDRPLEALRAAIRSRRRRVFDCAMRPRAVATAMALSLAAASACDAPPPTPSVGAGPAPDVIERVTGVGVHADRARFALKRIPGRHPNRCLNCLRNRARKRAWPTSGRINVEFGAKPGPGTGVLINGRTGQPILAAASGRVVYAGSGLIGYGQLIILKHNDTYLSAYGYTASLLVKEGQEVKKGQRIATMGEGPERKPRLHFEIRRNGKPVNPRQFLPAR